MAFPAGSARFLVMRDPAQGDVLKVWLYAAAAVFLGAWISPLFFNAGKALAEVAEAKQTNAVLDWLAGYCRAADFPDFFEVATVICAAILFVPFMDWLRGGRGSGRKCGWLRLPDGARGGSFGQPLHKNPEGGVQSLVGFSGVTVLFALLAGLLLLVGVFDWKTPVPSLSKLMFRGLCAAWSMAVLQEILFRGIAMGIFLRAMRPAAALGLSSFLFALAHLLHAPQGLNVLDPEASGVGFELLRKLAVQFSELRFVLGIFAPLLALGGVLAYARWKTASLWLPIGMHAGWIFVSGLIAQITTSVIHPNSLIGLLAGRSLHEGLLPLAGILIAGCLVIRLTPSAQENVSDSSA